MAHVTLPAAPRKTARRAALIAAFVVAAAGMAGLNMLAKAVQDPYAPLDPDKTGAQVMDLARREKVFELPVVQNKGEVAVFTCRAAPRPECTNVDTGQVYRMNTAGIALERVPQ